jgi:RNA 2',3'-cyclic 3'-phosphodiesterase
VRAFIAIDLDPGIKTALETLVRGLKATRADVRWVGPAGMHLTVKFLGEIDTDRAGRAQAVLSAVAGRHAAFPLRLEGTGAFPSEGSPRVLWVGFGVQPELLALQADLETAMGAEGFEREDRAFTPHLTLGRTKGPGRLAEAMAELARHRGDAFGGMTVRTLTLFESRLQPQGAEYRIVSEAGLS